MAVSVVSFLFSWCSTGGPAAQLSAGRWLSLQHLINIFSGPQLIRAPSPFGLVWLSLPHLVYNSGTGTNLTSVLTVLSNSSTPTQSPTRSLKSHVWSSSSGNNCHAVHRSLSSGVSVYECTMGFFFYLVPFRQPISAYAISSHNCASPLNGIFGRVEGQNTTLTYLDSRYCFITGIEQSGCGSRYVKLKFGAEKNKGIWMHVCTQLGALLLILKKGVPVV